MTHHRDGLVNKLLMLASGQGRTSGNQSRCSVVRGRLLKSGTEGLENGHQQAVSVHPGRVKAGCGATSIHWRSAGALKSILARLGELHRSHQNRVGVRAALPMLVRRLFNLCLVKHALSHIRPHMHISRQPGFAVGLDFVFCEFGDGVCGHGASYGAQSVRSTFRVRCIISFARKLPGPTCYRQPCHVTFYLCLQVTRLGCAPVNADVSYK